LNPSLGAREFASLCRLVAGEHLIFFTQDLYANRVQFVTGLGVDCDYFRRLALAAEAKILPPRLLAMPTATVKLAQSFWTGQDFDNSAFYNEVVRPDGGYHGLLATPFRKNRYGAFLAIERLRGQPDFDQSDARTLQTILPHLTNSMLIRLKLQEAEFNARESHRAFDLLDLGVFIVDADLRPSFLNKSAESLVSEADGLSMYRGKLQTAGSRSSAALRAAVKSAIALTDTRLKHLPDIQDVITSGEQLDLPRPSQRAALTATVMPVNIEHKSEFLAPPSRAIIFVRKQSDIPRLDVISLAEALNLTPRQATLTALLAQGATLGQAAAKLGLAMATVRWHLKEIFEKTDTHRQVDLVRLALQAVNRNEIS
jgi:DNA-binding CsgD family transcriptional regulator